MVDWDDVMDYNVEKILRAKIWRHFPDVENKKVFIKPNLVTPPTIWDEQSVTHRTIIEAVVKKCREKKAGEIIVGCCGFKDQWERTMKLGKYEEINVPFICVQKGENYHKYTLLRFKNKKDYLSLYGIKVSGYFLGADVVINLPKLKIHSLCGMTGAIKNLVGIISPKGTMHPRGSAEILHKRIRDLYFLLRDKVNWILMDGIIGAEYSEQYGVSIKAGILLSGTDMFEIDCLACEIMGIDKRKIKYLNYIKEFGIDYPNIDLPENKKYNFEQALSQRESL